MFIFPLHPLFFGLYSAATVWSPLLSFYLATLDCIVTSYHIFYLNFVTSWGSEGRSNQSKNLCFWTLREMRKHAKPKSPSVWIPTIAVQLQHYLSCVVNCQHLCQIWKLAVQRRGGEFLWTRSNNEKHGQNKVGSRSTNHNKSEVTFSDALVWT